MKVITAPETVPVSNLPTVFLAGGITNCPMWQDTIIHLLQDAPGILLNPRRKNFPIDDPHAAKKQITWEVNALHKANFFSMWFSKSSSDQPICMYELGRHVALRPASQLIVGVEPGYKREQDVFIQLSLLAKTKYLDISRSLVEQAAKIEDKVHRWRA